MSGELTHLLTFTAVSSRERTHFSLSLILSLSFSLPLSFSPPPSLLRVLSLKHARARTQQLPLDKLEFLRREYLYVKSIAAVTEVPRMTLYAWLVTDVSWELRCHMKS